MRTEFWAARTLGFVLIAVWTGGAWLASQAQARAQAVLPPTVSILMVLGAANLGERAWYSMNPDLGDIIGLVRFFWRS